MLNPCRKLRETGLPIVLVSLLGLGLVPLTSLASLFDEQTRVALDVSSRVNLNQVSDKSSMIHFVGLDFFRPFSHLRTSHFALQGEDELMAKDA